MWPNDCGVSVSTRDFTLTHDTPSSYAGPLRTRTRRGFDEGFGTEVFRREHSGSRNLDSRLHIPVRDGSDSLPSFGKATRRLFLYSVQPFQRPTIRKAGQAQDGTIKLWDIAVATQADK